MHPQNNQNENNHSVDSFWGRDILCHTLLSEVQNPLIITHSNTCSPDLSLCIRAKDSNPRKYPNARSFEFGLLTIFFHPSQHEFSISNNLRTERTPVRKGIKMARIIFAGLDSRLFEMTADTMTFVSITA